MTATSLLLGLLLLSYVGSILAGNRTIRGFGLPSGAEYLLLGFVLGSHVLGLMNRSLVGSFEPILIVGAAWLALVAGVSFPRVGERRVRLPRALGGVVLSALIGAGVAGGVYLVLTALGQFAVLERWLFAAAAGAVSCESTRHALRWVVERHGASGPLSNAIADLARASSLVPPAALSVLFAVMPAAGLESVSIGARVGITLGIGGLLGLVATLLLGREFRRDESWGILLGTSLLGMGVSERLGLSAVATSFMMGLTVALVSQHRTELKAMIAPTERPVMLPMTVLAGAFVEVDPATFMRWVLAVAIFGRLALELLRGLLLSFVLKAPRGSWVVLGLGMASTGPLSVGCAVAIAARFPDTLGPSALVIAAAGVLAGELVGPLSLRRALERAHEINEDSLIPPPVRPSLDDANRRSMP